jgi:hypothetical protein
MPYINPLLCRIISMVLMIFCQYFAMSQTEPETSSDKVHIAGIHFSSLWPYGDFKNQFTQVRSGFQVEYLHQLHNSIPVFGGFQFTYHPLARVNATLEKYIDFALVDVEHSTLSQIAGIYAKARYYPPFRLPRTDFYLEFGAGGIIPYTTTSKTIKDTESVDFRHEKGDIAPGYFFSAGSNIRLNNQLFLDIKASYYSGLSAIYYYPSRQNPIRESTFDAFNRFSGIIEFWNINIGINIPF